MAAAAQSPHVLLFPFPAQGHINSMLKLAQLLCFSGVRVTFINSEHNHDRLLRNTDARRRFSQWPGFRFMTVSDGLPAEHPRSAGLIVEVFQSLRAQAPPFLMEILRQEDAVNCVIADGIMTYVIDVGEQAGVPVVAFRTASPCSFWSYFCIPRLAEAGEIPFPAPPIQRVARRYRRRRAEENTLEEKRRVAGEGEDRVFVVVGACAVRRRVGKELTGGRQGRNELAAGGSEEKSGECIRRRRWEGGDAEETGLGEEKRRVSGKGDYRSIRSSAGRHGVAVGGEIESRRQAKEKPGEYVRHCRWEGGDVVAGELEKTGLAEEMRRAAGEGDYRGVCDGGASEAWRQVGRERAGRRRRRSRESASAVVAGQWSDDIGCGAGQTRGCLRATLWIYKAERSIPIGNPLERAWDRTE